MWYEQKTDSTGNMRYIYRERYTDPLTGKQKTVSVTLNSKSRLAQKQAAGMLKDKIDKKLDRSGIIEGRTLASVMDEWKLDFDRHSQKKKTMHTYQSTIQEIKDTLPENSLLSGISARVVQDLLDHWYYDKDKSFSCVNTMKTVIRHTLAYAKQCHYIKSDAFMHDVKIHKKPKTAADQQKEEEKYITVEEMRAILAEIRQINPPYALAAEFQALTGLRFGELSALRVRDYDEINGRICISGTMVESSRQDSTKTPESMRWVDLDARGIEIIKQVKVDNAFKKATDSRYKERGFLFTGVYGNGVCLATMNGLLDNLTCIDRHITTHALRHFHITILCEARNDIKAIMKRVGHVSPDITIRTYEHVTHTMRREIVESLDSVDLLHYPVDMTCKHSKNG